MGGEVSVADGCQRNDRKIEGVHVTPSFQEMICEHPH